MVKTLAKENRSTMSAMVAELVEAALELPKYQQQLAGATNKEPVPTDPRGSRPQAQFKQDTVEAAMKGVDLNHPKLAKLLKLMEVLESED